MVRRHIDQMIRTRNFKGRNESVDTGGSRLRKGKMSALKGSEENIRGKRKNSVQKEMLPVSATGIIVERKHRRPLWLQDRRHNMTEEGLRKEVEAVVLQEGNIKERAEIISKETVRIRHLITGILPYVKITNLHRDANSAESAYSGTLRVDSQPSNKSKKSGEKGSVSSLKNSKQMEVAYSKM